MPRRRKSVFNRRRYDSRQVFFDQYKVFHGCEKCGYRENPNALEFDHLDRDSKRFNIGQMKTASWEKIRLEIAKCRVVCANCHHIDSVENGHLGTPAHKPDKRQLPLWVKRRGDDEG